MYNCLLGNLQLKTKRLFLFYRTNYGSTLMLTFKLTFNLTKDIKNEKLTTDQS